jgi:excinuclease UvrABC nuclease subunit
LSRHLFQNIRDEAHRRAVGHHRRRREKLPG